MKKMKRIIICLFLVLASTMSVAQKKNPTGIRMEVMELTVNDEQYSLFAYTDDDSTAGYYLGIGHVDHLFEAVYANGKSTLSLDHIDETCLCLGYSSEEANASLDSLLALFECEVGTVVEIPARMVLGVESLGEYTTATCMMKKRLLGGKRLVFLFDSGRYIAESYLSRSSIKQLQRGLRFYKKMHPKAI